MSSMRIAEAVRRYKDGLIIREPFDDIRYPGRAEARAAQRDMFKISEEAVLRVTGAPSPEKPTLVSEVAAKAIRRVRVAPLKMERAAPPPTHHFAKATGALYADSRMHGTPLALVLKLIEYARGRSWAQVYIARLAADLGCSMRTIKRAIVRAEACGYVKPEAVRNGQRNDASIYRLTLAAAGFKPKRRRRLPDARRPVLRVTDLSYQERELSALLSQEEGCGKPLDAASVNTSCGAPLVAAPVNAAPPLSPPHQPDESCSASGGGQNVCHPPRHTPTPAQPKEDREWSDCDP